MLVSDVVVRYNKIGEMSNKGCSFSCIEDPDGNILTLQINSE